MKLRTLALAGFIALASAIGWLAVPAFQQLTVEQHAAASTRATLIAETIAHRIDAALRIGIPMGQISGIDALFAQYARHDANILSISLRNASGTLLHRRGESGRPDGISAISVDASEAGTGIRIEVLYANPTITEPLAEMASMVISLSVLGGALGFCFLTHSAERGYRARSRAVSRLCLAIRSGNLSAVSAMPRSCDFDRRPQWLARRMRTLRESHARLTRLIASLVTTEPSASGRAGLIALQDHCEKGLSFNSALPVPHRGNSRLAFLSGVLAAASASALRFTTPSESVTIICAMSWFALAVGLTFARLDTHFPSFKSQVFPSVLLGIAVLASLPLPSGARAPVAALLVGITHRHAPAGQPLSPLWLGDLVGCLAAVLVARLAPEAPAWLSIVAAGTAALCYHHVDGNAGDLHKSTPLMKLKDIPMATLHDTVAGIAVSFAVSTAVAHGFVESLPLTACLVGVCLAWQRRLSPTKRDGLRAIGVTAALLYAFTQWFWCFPLACACLAAAVRRSHAPRIPGNVRWLALTAGAGLTSVSLSSGAPVPSMLGAAGLLGIGLICTDALRTRRRG